METNIWAKKYHLIKSDLMVRYLGPLKKALRSIFGASEYISRAKFYNSNFKNNNYIIDKFEKEGFLRLKVDDDYLAELMHCSEEKFANYEDINSPNDRGKAFFKQLIDINSLSINHIFLKLALDEKILKIVGSKLKSLPYLESVELIYSLPLKGFSQSQNWHIDRTDNRVVKFFIYCSDVSEDNGPFTYLDKNTSSRVGGLFSPHYLSDEEVSKRVDINMSKKIFGGKGTAFLVDTMDCYHLGSRCAKPRLAYVAYYNTGFGYFPRQNIWSTLLKLEGELSAIQKFALGLKNFT